MYKNGDVIRAENGTCYIVEDVLPYEPANYVHEEYVLLCHEAKQKDEEYPLYSLGASGMVEIQRAENVRWETIGEWDPKVNDGNHCPWCGTAYDWEDDGDAENGPHLACWCPNDDCPGSPEDQAIEEYLKSIGR